MAKEISKKDLAARKARRAQKEMLAYMEEHDLDPNQDWTTHKKHGKKIQAWIDIINLGNKKARIINEEKAAKKAAEEKAKKKIQKPEVHPKKEKITSTPNIYDYPKVDGKEMTADQKKKYRNKMRTLLKTMSKEKAEVESKKFMEEMASGNMKVAPKKEKVKKEEPSNKEKSKEKKADKPSKEGKDKKKKKVSKEED